MSFQVVIVKLWDIQLSATFSKKIDKENIHIHYLNLITAYLNLMGNMDGNRLAH